MTSATVSVLHVNLGQRLASGRDELTRTLRNTRAVDLWLQNKSWRSIAHHLQAEGYGEVSHQYIARVVKRELQRAWEDTRRVSATTDGAALAVTDEAGPASPHQPAGAASVELQVESFFSARHFVVIDGNAGAPHHHSYRIRARFSGEIDRRSGIMLGFAEAQAMLDGALAPFNEKFLNTLPQFSREQPTTENLAMEILRLMRDALAGQPWTVTGLTLWENPTKAVAINSPSSINVPEAQPLETTASLAAANPSPRPSAVGAPLAAPLVTEGHQ